MDLTEAAGSTTPANQARGSIDPGVPYRLEAVPPPNELGPAKVVLRNDADELIAGSEVDDARGIFFVYVDDPDPPPQGQHSDATATTPHNTAQAMALDQIRPGYPYRVAIQKADQLEQSYQGVDSYVALVPSSIPMGVTTQGYSSAGLKVDVAMAPLKGAAQMTSPVAAVRNPTTYWICVFNDDLVCTIRSSFHEDVLLVRQGNGAQQKLILCTDVDTSVSGAHFQFTDPYPQRR